MEGLVYYHKAVQSFSKTKTRILCTGMVPTAEKRSRGS